MGMGDAAGMMELSVPQIRQLRAAYHREGAVGLAHGNRGRRPGNAIAAGVAERVERLAEQNRRPSTHIRAKTSEHRH
jgi:hypothetical protein